MNVSEIAADNTSFLFSIILGASFGMIYEIFRIIRIAFRHNTVAVFFEDIIYSAVITVLFMFYSFVMNSGEVKYFVIIGTIGGFTLYYFSLGKIVNRFSKTIIAIIKKLLLGIWKCIFKPIYVFFVNILHFLFTNAKSTVIIFNDIRNKNKDKRIKRRLLKDAEKGFGQGR